MTEMDLLREEVKKYIDRADENSLRRVQAILEIDQNNNWWENTSFVNELEHEYELLQNGTNKGVTLEELKASIDTLRKKRRKG